MSSECYTACMDAYGEQGYWLEAEKVFKCSQGGRKLSVLEFNVMIKAYGIAKLQDKALKLFESMESLGVFPDRCTYSSLIQMFAKSNCLNDSKHFISKMQEQGFIPSCGSFSAVIATCGRLGKTAEVEKMYKWMLKEQVEADITVYGALIDAFAEAGNVEKAVHYYSVMKDGGFAANSVVYSALIKMYSKCGLLKEARETFSMLKKLGDNVDIFSSNCMIYLYIRAGLIIEAQELFQHLKENRQANEFSHSMMLSFYKRIERYNEAIAIAKEMLNSGFLTNVLSFNNVIDLYVADGRLREAAMFLQKMLKLGVCPNKNTCRILGILLMKGGIPKWTVTQLESYHKDYNMQLLIGTVYSIVGMNDEALEALGPLSELETLNPDLFFYNVIIYAFGSTGKIDEASKMFLNMRTRGIEPDATTYTNMIIAYGKLGLVERVRSMFHQLKHKGIQPDDSTFTAVINAYKSAGRSHLAKLVTQERDYMHYLQEHGNFTQHSMPI
ncbi:hypothetical protein SUGI_0965990 [Cryptomeria japonica]|nr:hypothetical protein SUGI_0965990 [Cryptomeria japonica]